MRKKAKYSLIIGVVLIIILGVGFGVYRDEILGKYYFYKGEKCFEAKEYEQATKYLKTSLRFNPDNPKTHLLLMKTYWGRGLWEEMREERDRIIALGEEAPPIPLVIKDLEDAHITTTRSSEKEGWVYTFREAAWPGGSGIEFGAPDGGVLDYENIYRDGDTSTVPLPLKFSVGPADIYPEVQAPLG